MTFKSLSENLAKRARRAINEARRSGSASADPSVSARPDGSGENKSALYNILDYIVRTDTLEKERALELIKMCEKYDFSAILAGL